MKTDIFKMAVAGGSLICAIYLGFFIVMMQPEASTPLVAALILAGVARVAMAFNKRRARLRIARLTPLDHLMPPARLA